MVYISIYSQVVIYSKIGGDYSTHVPAPAGPKPPSCKVHITKRCSHENRRPN